MVQAFLPLPSPECPPQFQSRETGGLSYHLGRGFYNRLRDLPVARSPASSDWGSSAQRPDLQLMPHTHLRKNFPLFSSFFSPGKYSSSPTVGVVLPTCRARFRGPGPHLFMHENTQRAGHLISQALLQLSEKRRC